MHHHKIITDIISNPLIEYRIRHKMFETNSSSTHSIIIPNSAISFLGTLQLNHSKECTIWPSSYGWEWKIYRDPATKASYVLTWILTILGFKSEVSIKHRTSYKEKLHSNNHWLLLEDVIRERTKASRVIAEPLSTSPEMDFWGDIDHQSAPYKGNPSPRGDDFLESKEKLKQFIFSNSSLLITGNDNESPPPDIERELRNNNIGGW